MSYRNLYCIRDQFYFRTRVPFDLQEYFGKTEIRKSLGTKDLRDARFRVAALRSKTRFLFKLLRNKMLTKEQIKNLVHIYYTETLEELEQDRAEGFNLPKDEEDLKQRLETHEILLSEQRESLAYGNYKVIEKFADNLISTHKVEIEPGSPDYQRLCREMHKALIKIMEIETERMRANYDNEFDAHSLIDDLPTSRDKENPKGKFLSELIKEHVEEFALSKRWNEKTQDEIQSILDLFLEIIGDVDISSITRQRMTEVFEAIQRLPANKNKKKAYRDKTTREILEMDIPDPMNPTTVNKYMTRISSLFNWAIEQRLMDWNPAKGLRVKEKKKASEYRKVYTKEDLLRLVNSLKNIPIDKPERYWIPLIGMYSGMRLNEMCQLHVEDIREVDGILCFDLNERADKKLKTPSSGRLIPVHPILIDLGFLKYVEGLRERKTERLWPNLKRGRDGYIDAFSKWFGRHNRKHITEHPKKVFHSLRHTFINNLKQQGLSHKIIGELVGHVDESITTGRYGKNYEPKVLLETLKKLNYGILQSDIPERKNR